MWTGGAAVVAPRYRPSPRALAGQRVVVVGSGPTGTFAALRLSEAGAHVTVVERGKPVQPRRHDLAQLTRGAGLDSDSNYCFGEGGAGTFSDGKLYTRVKDKEGVRQVLERAVAWNMLSTNPARVGVTNPQRRPIEQRPFETWEELERVALQLGPRTGPLVPFAAATGLRPGEWTALEPPLYLTVKALHARRTRALRRAPYTSSTPPTPRTAASTLVMSASARR